MSHQSNQIRRRLSVIGVEGKVVYIVSEVVESVGLVRDAVNIIRKNDFTALSLDVVKEFAPVILPDALRLGEGWGAIFNVVSLGVNIIPNTKISISH